MLEQYEQQLNKITSQIDSFFAEQKDYIKCKIGCSLCCSNGYYPISELEYSYLRKGIEIYFSKEDINLLHQKVWDIYKNRQKFMKHNKNVLEFSYMCPFLVNDSCTVYNYRPIICRAHGLIAKDSINTETKCNMPYCVNQDLNYANVWDKEKNTFSKNKIAELRLKIPPQKYNVSCSAIMKTFEGANFGDIRMIYEWVIMDIPNYQEIMQHC